MLLAACLAGAVAIRHPFIGNDSYQYMSVAMNLRSHHQIATSAVYFPAERSHGVIPAPFTTQPPGYPIAISCLSFFLPLQSAALTVSVISGALLTYVLWRVMRWWNATPLVSRVLLAIWVFNYWSLFWASSALADSLFALVVVCGLSLLFYDKSFREYPGWASGGSLFLLALAYAVRYAGLFFLVPTAAYVLWRQLRTRLTAAPWSGTAAAAAVVATIMLRNAHYLGSWKGTTSTTHRSFWSVAAKFPRSAIQLALGPTLRPLGLTFIIIVLAALAVILALRQNLPRYAALFGDKLTILLAAIIVPYAALIVVAETKLPIELGPRYLFPLLPLGILLLVRITLFCKPVRGHTRSLILGLTMAALLGYCFRTIALLSSPSYVPPHIQVARYLDETTAEGVRFRDSIEQQCGEGAAIVSVEGQAMAYLLQRPTIGLASQTFSQESWDDSSVRKLMKNYGAECLVLYPNLPKDDAFDSVQRESPFLQALLRGERPSWLSMAAQDNDVIVYKSRREPSP